MTLRELEGSRWQGTSELWLDQLQNEAAKSDCTVEIARDVVRYTWTYEGKPQEGSVTLRDGGADFTDTMHSPKPMSCTPVAGSWALVDVQGTYTWQDSPPWGWRITVSRRPESDELLVQMTNIHPWGEEGRAVRMICRRSPA